MPPILNPPPHTYGLPGLDRAAHRRRDLEWLAACRSDARTRIIFLSDLRVPVLKTGDVPVLWAPTLAELGEPLPDHAIFLGEREGEAWFAVDLGEVAPRLGEPVELRSIGLLLPAADASLVAYARALSHWHQRHRFCGVCGHPTEIAHAGHTRHCPSCGNDHFPRTDPAGIVLVTHGDRCLLGRSPRFPKGMYSTLAGFVEPGESVETCLIREVYEEAGIAITDLTYRSSQPWPFPQSLMLGFRARALTTELRLDPDELEDALWLTREELKDEARRPVTLPRADSIARYLIEEWLAEQT